MKRKPIFTTTLLCVTLALTVTAHAQETGGGTPGLAFELIPSYIDYTVVRGDTVYSIARANKISLETLMKINRIADSSRLRTGDVIKIPVQEAYRVSKGTVTSGTVIIPAIYNGVPVTEIGRRAFQDTNITSITIPESVTTIENSAFENCRNLTSITIPSSVTSIGSSTFDKCTSLTSVTISRRTTITIGKDAFPDGVTIIYSD